MEIASITFDEIENRSMDSCEENQRVKIGKDCVEKVIANPLRARFIETCTRLEVFCRVLEYYYSHGSELR